MAWRATNGDLQVAGRRSTLLIPFVLACAILADRGLVGITTGGRGVLPLLTIVAPLAALVTIARYGIGRSLGFLGKPAFLLGVLPYLALTALFPVLGVMFNAFPERTLLSLTEATTGLSFLVIGAALSSSRDGSWSRWLLVAVTVQFLYAAGQAVYLSRGPGWELFTPFHEWDSSLQDPLTFVQGRSSGLYFNPNVLGLWAGFAVILSWRWVTPWLRGTAVALSVLTLLLSQSRGGAVALLAALVVAALLSVTSRGGLSARTLKGFLSFTLAFVVALSITSLVAPEALRGDRFGALLEVLAVGPQADPNLAGRLDFWAAVTALNSVYPWGTWGSPELLLGTSVDSTWFRLFAQGSILYVVALVSLLGAAFSVSRSAHRLGLRLVAVLVAVAGLSQTPFGYPVIVLFWVLLGAGLQASVADPIAPHRIPADPLAAGIPVRMRAAGPKPTYEATSHHARRE
ncbi:MAG: hypothetical protein ABI555_06590 [Chloroflexota bacterium]